MSLILNKETNFITTDDLFVEIHNMLPSFFERSILDDSLFYPVVRECLAKLGAKIYPVSDTTLIVENYKAKLPADFHKLVYAVGYFERKELAVDTLSPQLFDVKVGDVKTIEKPIKLSSEYCVNDCGEIYQVVQRVNSYEYVYTDLYPLRIKSSNSSCVQDCLNKINACKDEISINGGTLYTNFCEGQVFISYLQNLESSDGDLLVPDYAQIREWIKSACITKAFEKIYWNGEADVQQRLLFAKKEEAVRELNARSFARRSEFSELYDMRKFFFNRYSKFENVVYGSPYNRNLPRYSKGDTYI